MSSFVKSLKRLYESGKVTDEKLLELYSNGKISLDEYEHITGHKGIPSEF